MGRGRQPIRAKILMSTERPNHYGHLLHVWKESLQPLTLYTSFHDLINVYSRRSGADNPRGQNFYVNRNLLSLRSFATSFKKNLFNVWFYTFFFSWFYTCIYSPGQGLIPWGWNMMSTGTSYHFGHLLQVSKHLFEVWFYTNFFMILYMYIAPRQGQTIPRGQSFDVNRNVLSLHSFVASLKKNILKVWCLYSGERLLPYLASSLNRASFGGTKK